jgi:hypothetical protein
VLHRTWSCVGCRKSRIVGFGVKVPRIASWVTFQPSLRDWFVSGISSQDYVLGYSQPSLRDSLRKLVLTHSLKPSIFSAVTARLKSCPDTKPSFIPRASATPVRDFAESRIRGRFQQLRCRKSGSG